MELFSRNVIGVAMTSTLEFSFTDTAGFNAGSIPMTGISFWYFSLKM